MPASSSETRNRWRKRKREPQINRKPKPQDEDEIEDEEEEDNNDLEFDEDPINQNPSQSNRTGPTPIARESEVLLDGGVRVSVFPPVVRHTVNRYHSSVVAILAMERENQSGESSSRQNPVALENISHGQLQALSAVPPDSLSDPDRADGSSGAYVITPPGIIEGRGVVKRFGNSRVHVVPMHADWFSPYTVHRLERQVVPHYFSGKSVNHTPEKYMECRNRIVAKYMENPEKRLTVSDCDGLAVGVDIDDMTRILRFLDHWGIINYCAALDRELQNDGSCFSEDSNGELRVPMTLLKSIDSLIQFDRPKCRLSAADVYPELGFRGREESDLDSRIRERLSENQCNYCARPLPIMYYQSQKEVDVLLCLDCFHEGRFITGHSSLDFTRVDSGKDYGDLDGENWTDQETLLLLEAMEIYSENWNEIAEHVGTKSKAQCILHFLRLPMDDSSLENVEVPSTPIPLNISKNDECERSHSNSNGNAAGSSLQDPDSDTRLPFANYANPVMALVAFLASAVGPRVAAACAHASLAALSEEDHGQIDGSGCGNRMNSENMHGKEGGPRGDITKSSQQKEVATLTDEKVRTASKAGLSAAATKAKLFADHEEREIQRLSANIINHQLKRLELKLKQFAEVETMLMKECEQVERVKQRMATERALTVAAQFGPAGVTRPTGVPGVVPVMVQNNVGNTRQQVLPGAPSQPFISGYGNNQPIHPHVSPMQQQPTFGLGPLLPLSSINPSSSASANVNTPRAMLRSVSGGTRSGLD